MQTYNTTWRPGEIPSVLYFTAPWCQPCKRFGPVLEKVAEHVPDVVFIKVDADEFFELAAQYNIKSLPTLVYLDPNQPGRTETLVGAHNGDDVLHWLEMQ